MNCIIHPSVMIRKRVFESHQYDQSFRTCQDYKLWSDCLADCIFHNIKEPLILYQINKNGVSRKERHDVMKRFNSLRSIYETNIKYRFPYLTPEELQIISKCISGLFVLSFEDAIRFIQARKKYVIYE